MANVIMRHQIADFINTAKEGETENYALMGVGYNTLDENPSAQTDGKTYIHEKAQSSSIISYQPVFPFDTDLVADEDAVMALYEVGRDQKTGMDAEKDYIRVELFRPISDQTATYAARKFKVSVQVESVTGAGGETIHVSGNLNGVGDFVDGTFNTSTKVFTEV